MILINNSDQSRTNADGRCLPFHTPNRIQSFFFPFWYWLTVCDVRRLLSTVLLLSHHLHFSRLADWYPVRSRLPFPFLTSGVFPFSFSAVVVLVSLFHARSHPPGHFLASPWGIGCDTTSPSLNNVPLPVPKTSACLIGGTLHFIYFCIRASKI